MSDAYHRDSEMGVVGDASLTGSQEELEGRSAEARRGVLAAMQQKPR